MNNRKLLAQLQNSCKNVKYNDFTLLVESFGFKYRRTDGSHNIFKNVAIRESINLQEEKGETKPYQVKQFLALIEKHNLRMENEE